MTMVKERYYVDYREGTSAGWNELQSTEIDNEGNLIIKIGDFSKYALTKGRVTFLKGMIVFTRLRLRKLYLR